MDAICNLEFDYVASGHYARVVHPTSDRSEIEPSILELSEETVQSLFIIILSSIGIKCFYISQKKHTFLESKRSRNIILIVDGLTLMSSYFLVTYPFNHNVHIAG